MKALFPLPTRSVVACALVGALWLLALALPACNRTCDKVLQRIEACADTAEAKRIHHAPGVREAVSQRCRRADPDRVRSCLQHRQCKPFLQCVVKAVQPRVDQH